MEKKNLFTSESVSEGHPDKVSDQIADAILDECLKQDPRSRVACEVFCTTNFVLIGGEITSNAKVNYKQIARNVIRDIGYTKKEYGFSDKTAKIVVKMHQQSPDIAMGVDAEKPEDIGAGDQGIMFGFATNESEGLMPLPIVIAHKLVRVATHLRKTNQFKGARPDMKSQVTVDYSNPKKPRVTTVLMSIQHDPDLDMNLFKKYVKEQIMLPVVLSFGLNEDFQAIINPTGNFVIGGPAGDTGVTGRKIIVDTYGGAGHHGGGAFSGKDPTKVDRSASYMARYIAKNLVGAGVMDKCEIQLGYAIGKNEPVSLYIESFGTSKIKEEKVLDIIHQVFDLRPGMIIKNFSLTQPIFEYHKLTNYGHFGRPDLDLPWEKLDKVEEIQNLLK
ncbi:MAG: methionine adenosyltransferase [Firmicutes bacterium]|nr:methionine adenosyltransferase [Candidatus Fiminaster equi]